MKTSEHLTTGEVYARAGLQQRFGISDATIRTGVFHPKGHESVWLFVTEQKTSDRTPYVDHLEGDLLRWDGQTMGRTDDLIVNHSSRALELLVFYRHSRTEYPGAAFRYEGPFEYVSHEPGHPSRFTLRRLPPSLAGP